MSESGIRLGMSVVLVNVLLLQSLELLLMIMMLKERWGPLMTLRCATTLKAKSLHDYMALIDVERI